VQPSIGEYAIVTGHGALSSTQVQQVVQPGVTYTTGSGTTDWFVPAGVRNYVTGTDSSNSDRVNPQAELTGTLGNQAGMSDLTYTYVGFELNPALADRASNYAFADQFLKFCLKYGCASTTAQNDSGNSGLAHASTPGWNTMLSEIFPHAIDNATQSAIQGFDPNLWNTRGDWPKLAADIQRNLPGEIAKMTGTGSGKPYFCGPGATEARCPPPLVLVNDVVPSDPGVQQAYNQEQTALYDQKAAAAQLNAAKAKYGPDAYWALAMQDLVGDCKGSGVPCTIYAGNPPVHP
jgi:hypothetical protein